MFGAMAILPTNLIIAQATLSTSSVDSLMDTFWRLEFAALEAMEAWLWITSSVDILVVTHSEQSHTSPDMFITSCVTIFSTATAPSARKVPQISA